MFYDIIISMADNIKGDAKVILWYYFMNDLYRIIDVCCYSYTNGRVDCSM